MKFSQFAKTKLAKATLMSLASLRSLHTAHYMSQRSDTSLIPKCQRSKYECLWRFYSVSKLYDHIPFG